VIIWLNGTFGVGKTATARELTALLPRSRIFDTEELGLSLHHVVLHAEHDELLRRIETDPSEPNSRWRLDHLDDYDAARSWHSEEAQFIDTTALRPREVATLIANGAHLAVG
jgi:hypothetical protein